MIQIPQEVFKYATGEEQIKQESKESLEVIDIDTSETINLIVKDANFPYKIYVSQEMLWHSNILKSFFIESIKVISKWYFIPSLIISCSSVSKVSNFIESFNRIGHRVLSPYILKDKHLSRFSQQFQFLIFTFLYKLGIEEPRADKFAELFTHLIETDDAYRTRLQDLFSETTKYRLLKPQKEIKRLVNINKERDSWIVNKKLGQVAFLIRIALLIPKVKKAYIETINEINLEELRLDDADMYWTLFKKDYKYLGMDKEEHAKYAEMNGWKYPNLMI